MKSKIIKKYGTSYGTRFAAVEFDNGDRVDVRIRGSKDGKLLNHFGDTSPTEETRVDPIKKMAETLRIKKNPARKKRAKKKATRKKATRRKNPSQKFTASQLSQMRKNFSKINKVDLDKPTYNKIIKYLDGLPQPLIKQLAKARIKFLSGLASNRIKGKA